MNFGYIFWTTASFEEAKQISKELLDKRLIACANILPKIRSFYIWEGDICEDEEVKVIFKTSKVHYPDIEEIILGLTSYETPEITYVEVQEMHEPYKKWLEKSIS